MAKSEDEKAEESRKIKALTKKYMKASYKELATRMQELSTQAGEAEEAMKGFKAEFDLIRLVVVPERFAEDDIKSLNIAGIGRLGLTSDMHCNTEKSKKEEFYQWLRDNELGDLIKDEVNSSSLKAAIKELRDSEDEKEQKKYEKIQDYVKVHPFMRASVTKT